MCDAAQTRRCTEVNLQAASKPPVMTLTPINDQDQVLAQLRAELCDVRRELAACRLRESAALGAAQLDPLTGLANRRLLDGQVGRQLLRHGAHHTLLALLFIDLDDFKTVNDRHGHAVGDALLKLVGLRLRHAVRQQDLVCRLGGDEFVCVLFDLRGEHEAQVIERKLHAAIHQPCHVDALTLTVRPSIGSALYPRDGADVPELLAHADRMMYRHKPRGAQPPVPAEVASVPRPPATRVRTLPRWLNHAVGTNA
jgi:diguanylate cyclase (GGDEF)-like protein